MNSSQNQTQTFAFSKSNFGYIGLTLPFLVFLALFTHLYLVGWLILTAFILIYIGPVLAELKGVGKLVYKIISTILLVAGAPIVTFLFVAIHARAFKPSALDLGAAGLFFFILLPAWVAYLAISLNLITREYRKGKTAYETKAFVVVVWVAAIIFFGVSSPQYIGDHKEAIQRIKFDRAIDKIRNNDYSSKEQMLNECRKLKRPGADVCESTLNGKLK